MKKITIMTMLLLVAVACNDQIKPEASVAPKEGITFFTASTDVNEEDAPDEVDSKTAIFKDGSTYRVIWKAEDSISISNGESSYKYIATPGETDATSAYFYPEQSDLVLPAGEYYALYPYDESAVWDGSKVTFTIPETQVCVPGSFPYNPSVAYTTDNSLAFKNIGVLIKYKVNSTKYNSVVFEAVGGEPLTGTVIVDCKDPEDRTIVDGYPTLTLNGTNNNSYNYVTILPGTYTEGIRIMFFRDKGYKSVRTSKNLILGRNRRIETGDVLLSATIQVEDWGIEKTSKDTIMVDGSDYIYHSLECGLDVAFAPLSNGEGHTWQSYCDPDKTLTTETVKNLYLEDVPFNPCPDGWNLPTMAQLEILQNEANTNIIQSDNFRHTYWKLKDGSLAVHTSIFGSNDFQLMSSETDENGACYAWNFAYNTSFEINKNYISRRDITVGNKYYWFRCVRNTPEE